MDWKRERRSYHTRIDVDDTGFHSIKYAFSRAMLQIYCKTQVIKQKKLQSVSNLKFKCFRVDLNCFALWFGRRENIRKSFFFGVGGGRGEKADQRKTLKHQGADFYFPLFS